MHRLSFAFLAFLLCASAPRAQGVPPSGSTIDSGGGPGGDVGQSVDADPLSGETVVVGTFGQTATFGSVSVTSADAPSSRSDAFVVKYDVNDEAVWARRMGTDVFNDFGAGVALAPVFTGSDGSDVGSVYVSGYFTGIATFDGGANPTLSLTTRNDFDAFLAKYSPDGDLLWVEQAGGSEQDTGRGVTVDYDGRVCWVGSFAGTATWGSGDATETRTSAGSSDGFLACYLPDGTLDKVTVAGGAENDGFWDIDSFGEAAFAPVGVAVAGTFRSVVTFGATPLQSRGASDVVLFLVRTGEPELTIANVQQVGGSGNDYARGVATSLFDQRAAVVGSFENDLLIGTTVLTSAGASDAFMAVFEFEGTPVGAVRGGGTGFDIANGVAATPFVPIVTRGPDLTAPVFAMTGYIDGASTFSSSSVVLSAAAQGTDAFALIYRDEVELELVDVLLIGGGNSDRGNGVVIGGRGDEILLTGSFRDTIPFASASVTSAGGNDVFVARVPLCPTYSCVIVADETGPVVAEARLGVSPNPSRSPSITLSLAATADVTVEIVDALGRVQSVLHRGALGAGDARLGVPDLAPGVYVVRVRGDVEARRSFVVIR